MWIKTIDWSRRGRAQVWFWTIFGTFLAVLITSVVDTANITLFPGVNRTRDILTDILLPMFLASPAIFMLTSKIRELAIVHHELSIVASTDNLTAVLNRGAFTMLVEAYLEQTRVPDSELYGALLVVDADNFKSINDRFGHDSGDEALKIIASAIKGLLRGADLVGRIGGEEFLVFLPGSTPQNAEVVAERIRGAIADADFHADGFRQPLSVSVGGATFEKRIAYKDLFRVADRRLYAAKEAGRDQVSIVNVDLVAKAA
jgi:diguanylate cyclase